MGILYGGKKFSLTRKFGAKRSQAAESPGQESQDSWGGELVEEAGLHTVYLRSACRERIWYWLVYFFNRPGVAGAVL